MERSQDGGSGGGYPHFSDTGGPTGSDQVYVGLDERGVQTILDEVRTPIISETADFQLFNPGEFISEHPDVQVALDATRTCIIQLRSIAELKSVTAEEFAKLVEYAKYAQLANSSRGVKRSFCKAFCIVGYLGMCPIAMEGFILDHGRDKEPLTSPHVETLVGIGARGKNKNKPQPSEMIGWIYNNAMSPRGEKPANSRYTSTDFRMIDATEDHLAEWRTGIVGVSQPADPPIQQSLV